MIKHFFVQNSKSLKLLKSIQIDQVSISGDTRFDRVKQTVAYPKAYPIIEQFKGDEPLLIIGSAWASDMEVLSEFINSNKEVKIIIAPHEIEQRDIRLITKYLKKPFDIYSEGKEFQTDVLVLDTRNTYEVSIGTFKKSVQPETTNFREFPDWLESLESSGVDKNKKVAMFCTGGIRCEKASSLMKAKGFSNIYHLQGGILNYMDKVDEKNSLWQGECFVFDDRVALNHNLEVGSYDMCHGCRMPITEADKLEPEYERGVSCPNCFNEKTPDQKKRYADRQKQVDLAKLRNEKHIGAIFQSSKK